MRSFPIALTFALLSCRPAAPAPGDDNARVNAIASLDRLEKAGVETQRGGPVGALQTDCGLGGARRDGSYHFVSTCAGRSVSPDGRLAIVQKAYESEQPPVEVQDRSGRALTTLPSISDDMPFTVYWAPNSRRFFVNHHVGSFMSAIHLFRVDGASAFEDGKLAASAVREAVRRYPCLRPTSVHPHGMRWSADSRRIILLTTSAAYACSLFGAAPGEFESLWMIGDVVSGKIDAGSVRPLPDEPPFPLPTDGPYADF